MADDSNKAKFVNMILKEKTEKYVSKKTGKEVTSVVFQGDFIYHDKKFLVKVKPERHKSKDGKGDILYGSVVMFENKPFNSF